MKPLNSVDKYTVAAISGWLVVGLLEKGTNGKFAKTILYFLKCDESNRCLVEVTGKRRNLGDGEGMQVPCMQHFEERKVYINRLWNVDTALCTK